MSAPAISNVSPNPGVAITEDTPLAFDVTDSTPFREIVVLVKFNDAPAYTPWEVVYDGSAFGPNYVDQSAKTSITNGFHFRLVRRGGWPSAPTLLTHAIDTSGAEAP